MSMRLSFLFCARAILGVVSASMHDDAPYRTIQFTPNITHRTNLCERQQLLRTGDLEFLDVLRGMELTVALPYFPGIGVINYDEQTGTFEEYPGYYIDVLDKLAALAGFSWRKSWALIDPSTNETVNDLMFWVVNTYDFTFGEFESSAERMQLGIDFPRGYSDSSTILIARHQQAKSSLDLFSFLAPFHPSVWFFILATIILSGLAYRCIHKTYSPGQSSEQSFDKPVMGINIFNAAQTATGQMNFSPVTHGERIFVFSLSFWSMIMLAAYTANLASVMIAKVHPVYPATSMIEAERKGVSVCVIEGWAVATKLKRDYPDAKIIEIEGISTMYELLRENDRCDLVADSASRFEMRKVNKTLNSDCSLRWVGRAVDISTAGPANIVDTGFYCTSLVGHVFDYYLNEMKRSGYLEEAFERFISSESTHICPAGVGISSNADEAVQLTMLDMGGIFVIHGILCVIGLLVSYMQSSSEGFAAARLAQRDVTTKGDAARDEPAKGKTPCDGPAKRKAPRDRPGFAASSGATKQGNQGTYYGLA